MDHVIIDAGTLEFSEEDLTATGLIVPFGVKARSNLGEFEVDPGIFEIPTDTTGTALNVEHKREDVVGGVARAWEQGEGILAAMRFADTPAGRKAFTEAKTGKRRHLSVEAAGVKIKNGRAIAGRIFGVALVERPAFQGATLLAAEDTGIPAAPAPPQESGGDVEIQLPTLPKSITVITDPPEGASAVYTPEAEPAEANPEGGSIVTATATEPGQQTPAAVPSTLLASAPTSPENPADVDLGTIFASMAAIKAGAFGPDAETLLAALSDIKVETSGGLTVANSGIVQPAWVGKLWQGRRYQRKYLDLLTHLFGGIALGGRKGFKLDQGTALVTEWSGNKTEIGSGTGTTSITSSSRKAYGYAADVAREWYDLEGGAEVIQAFFEGVVDSYAKVTDLAALATIFLTASKTTTALDRLVAPATYPTQYTAAMGQLIQGIEAISDADDDATFAIVNPTAWTQLLFTPKDLVPEFVEFGVGIGTGEATAGKVRVVKAPQSYFTGTVAANPQTIVGAKPAIEFREQGETPIQIDALDIAKGGVDKAVIGYLETFIVRPESLVLIGTKP